MTAFRVRPWDRWASRLATKIRPVGWEAAPRTRAPPPHDLLLYDFEASPWCRLVREYATILDLTLVVQPCPRETLLFGEGSFGPESRFRPHAMKWHQQKTDKELTDHLTFPLLVDRTKHNDGDYNDTAGAVILTESYEILTHLWDHYGESVRSSQDGLRPDQVANAADRSFAARFVSLAGPSYLRPWPRCGLLRFPSRPRGPTTANATSSSHNHNNTNTRQPPQQITLYQAEGCPASRLVREALCCLEIPYRSVPVAPGSWNALPHGTRRTEIPILQVVVVAEEENGTEFAEETFVGADECLAYLRETYYDCDEDDENYHPRSTPTWFDPLPSHNLGRSGGSNFSVLTAALAALRTGRRKFVPEQALR